MRDQRESDQASANRRWGLSGIGRCRCEPTHARSRGSEIRQQLEVGDNESPTGREGPGSPKDAELFGDGAPGQSE